MSVPRSSRCEPLTLPALGAPPLPKRARVGARGFGPVVALFALFAFLTAAVALDFPALTGRAVDEANILDATTREALTTKLAALEAKNTDQLVVVTLKSLQGTTIEDFGVQLGRTWKIGQKD